MQNDLELLEASLTGDKQSFSLIVERYKSVVCAITYNATGNITVSEDIAQETFIAAWKSLNNLRDKSKFKSWLYGIARNLCSNYIRKKYQDVVQQSIPLEEVQEQVSSQVTPRDEAISKEEESILWKAIEGIPESYREPLILYYRENRSIKSVAEALDLSEDTIKQRLSRGRNMLRIQVAEFVEKTLSHTGPKETFAISVISLLPTITQQVTTASILATATKGSSVAKSGVIAGLSGVILGPILGVLGGILGITAGIVNTKSLRERQFMKKISAIFVLLVLVYLGVSWILIKSFQEYRFILYPGLGLIYLGALVFLILWSKRKQKQIQIEDGTYIDPKTISSQPTRLTKSSINGSFAGIVFGTSAWLISMSIIAQDWLSAFLTLVVATIIYLSSTKTCLLKPDKYWRIASIALSGAGIYTLILINWRWVDWMKQYQQSVLYNPKEDLSIWTINLLIISIYLFLLGGFNYLHYKNKSTLK